MKISRITVLHAIIIISGAIFITIGLAGVSSALSTTDLSVGKWSEFWQAAKKEFETETNAKKPSKSFLKVRKGTGIDSQAKKVEKAYKEFRKVLGAYLGSMALPKKAENKKAKKARLNKVKKTEKAFGKARKKYKNSVSRFSGKVDKYVSLLKTSIKKEKKGSELKRELKLLKKRLKAIKGQMEGQSGVFEVSVARAKVKFENPELSREVLNVKKSKAVDPKIYFKACGGAIKKARLWGAEMKKKLGKGLTTKEQENGQTLASLFNSGVNTAARDITQSLSNIIIAAKNKNSIPLKKDPSALAEMLEQWGNKRTRTLKKNAELKIIQTELKVFLNTVSSTSKWLKNEQKK